MTTLAISPAFEQIPPQQAAKPQKRTLLQKIWVQLNRDQARNEDVRVCREIDRLLAEKEGLPPKQLLGQVHNDPTVDMAKKFLREHKTTLSDHPDYERLRARFTALRLGLTGKELLGKSDFISFATKNYLHRYLLGFDHTLRTDPETGEVLIRHKGEEKPWSEVKTLISLSPAGILQGQYSKDGLIDEDINSWTEFKPFKWEDPANWNHQYVYEHCLWTHENLQLTDNHSWVRLRTPEGDVYSVGEWPADKGQAGSWLRFPLRLKEARLQSPDCSEFWGGVQVKVLGAAITKEQFEAMKAQIEADRNNTSRSYHMLHRNCTTFANKIGAIAGLSIDSSKVPVTHVILPGSVRSTVLKTYSLLPSPLKRVAAGVTGVAVHAFAALMGYWTYGKPHDAEIPEKRRAHLPPLTALTQIPTIDHPHPTLYKYAEEVYTWRQKEEDRLKEEVTAIYEQLANEEHTTEERQSLGDRLDQLNAALARLPYALPA